MLRWTSACNGICAGTSCGIPVLPCAFPLVRYLSAMAYDLPSAPARGTEAW
jgi:hypothetical protein